jgi:hypothetical protein
MSRPKPLRFFPPHGIWQKHGWLQLTHTMPVWKARVSLSQRAASAEITAAASPYSVSFAAATASSSEA